MSDRPATVPITPPAPLVRSSTRVPAIAMIVARDDPSTGGTQRQALLLAERLPGAGVPVTVVTGRPAGRRTPAWRPPRPDVLSVRLPVWSLQRAWCFLAMLLFWAWRHRQRTEILHAHSVSLGVIACIVGWLTRAPVVVKVPSWKSLESVRGPGVGRWVRRWIVGHASRIVAVSEELREAAVREGFAPDRVVVIPNGVDLDGSGSADDSDRLKAEVVGAASAFVVLFVGRLVEEKAVDRLLRVWAALPEGRQVLLIVGDGALRRSLETMAHALGVAATVRFLGHRPDVYRFYAMADVFVLPSATEGLSNALLEAMATGLPVVASDVGGNRGVLTSGSGILVDWRDVPACASALARLLEDGELRRQLGAAALRRAQVFAIDSIVERYRDLYRAVAQA